MDLNFDDATLAFQAEVRDFLASNKDSFPTKSYDTAEGFEQHRRWDKVLFDAGLSVITWPEKYGGRDASLLQWVVYEEEYFRAGAPGRASANGTSMLAPTLFAHGTEAQLDRVLPKMASGEEIWAQAWSEPESGSDLASLRSTATKTDGGWLLNGQKIWSSRAPFGERAFGLFRSDPEAERHRGLTYFMFDLSADGVTVRPIAQLCGDTGFGEKLDPILRKQAELFGLLFGALDPAERDCGGEGSENGLRADGILRKGLRRSGQHEVRGVCPVPGTGDNDDGRVDTISAEGAYQFGCARVFKSARKERAVELAFLERLERMRRRR